MRFSLRRIAVVAATGVLVVGAAGCGDADDPGVDEAASGSAADVATPEATLGDVDAAKALITASIEGPVFSAKPELEVGPADLEPATAWNGPKTAPAPPERKHVQIVVCVYGSTCQTMGDAAAAAAEELGWTAEVLDGKGTPQGANDAMNASLAKRPDAIITVAVPASQVADKVARAREAGIKVIGISSIKENIPDDYDAYVSLKETLTAKFQAWWAIADSGGTAKVVFIWDKGYPHLVEALSGAEAVLEACSACEVLEVYKRTLATAADPVAMGQLANSVLQKYGNEVGYILTPYGFGVAPVAQAVAASGKDVKVTSKNADALNLGLVKDGTQAADFGSSAEWAGWAAIDQSIRLLAGEEPIPDAEEGLPVRTYDKDSAPANGEVNWSTPVDFKAEYRKIWGTG